MADPQNMASHTATNSATSQSGLRAATSTKSTDGEDRGTGKMGEEEFDIYTMVRMLEDRHGNLQFFGDSSNISFVQLLRMIVETVYGPCHFALDPDRHQLTQGDVDSSFSHENIMPAKDTAIALMTQFFTNTFGVFEIFDEKTCLKRLHDYYDGSMAMDRTWQCHMYLMLAIGLRLATPMLDSHEAKLIQQLRSQHPNRSDEYALAAEHLNGQMADPDRADFPAIQTLTLLALHKLHRADRNAAYIFTGTAVRLAYSHGLHRNEVMTMFSKDEQIARRKLWRTLLAIDCYQAVSLGRPLAIGEAEGTLILQHSTTIEGPSPEIAEQRVCRHGIEATIRACKAMRLTLRKVYVPRKVSLNLARSLSEENNKWPKELPQVLHPQEVSPNDVRKSMAIVHSNLANYHSILLLTRPFFLQVLSIEVQKSHLKKEVDLPKQFTEMQRLSNACMVASIHTINLLQTAYEGGYLPRVNLWPTYGIFCAALVIFANEIARPSKNSIVGNCIKNSITILDYCGEEDPLASRSSTILRAFLEVLQAKSKSFSYHTTPPPSSESSMSQAARSVSGSMTQGSTPARQASVVSKPKPRQEEPPPQVTMPAEDPRFAQWAAEDFSRQIDQIGFNGPLDLGAMVEPFTQTPMLPSMEEDVNFDDIFDFPGYDPHPYSGTN